MKWCGTLPQHVRISCYFPSHLCWLDLFPFGVTACTATSHCVGIDLNVLFELERRVILMLHVVDIEQWVVHKEQPTALFCHTYQTLPIGKLSINHLIVKAESNRHRFNETRGRKDILQAFFPFGLLIITTGRTPRTRLVTHTIPSASARQAHKNCMKKWAPIPAHKCQATCSVIPVKG